MVSRRWLTMILHRVFLRQRHSSATPRRHRPCLEGLEDRCLPSILSPIKSPNAAAAVSAPAGGSAAGDVRHVTLQFAPGLFADVFSPRHPGAAARRLPAVAIFHGGGFVGGSPRAWFPTAKFLAEHGAVAIAFQYRLGGQAGLPTSVADAQTALRWMRFDAARLGINPDAIVATGDSAGGYLALMTALGDNQPGEMYNGMPAGPNAVIAFYPVIDGSRYNFPPGLSPLGLSRTRLLPPTLLLQGTGDQVITPYATAVRFAADEPTCQFVAFPGRDHGFFLKRGSKDHRTCLILMERFLHGLGLLRR